MPADAPPDAVHFTFDGREIVALPGQTVAGALFEAGVTTLTRSVKYRRARGIHCAAGYCPSCLLRVDGRPHVRSCMTPVSDGLRVESDGSAAARWDPLRAIDRVAPLFPVGFQYRYFKRQGPLWRLWERRLRKAAAESEVPEVVEVPEAERVAVDLLVVGGGPAGVAAAAAGAEAGLSVLLATRRPQLGGGLRPALQAGSAPEALAPAIAAVQGSPRTRLVAPGTVVAAFDGVYLVDAGTHLIEVTSPASILASGAYERAIIFPGNDRPGVMLTSAVRRLALEEGVLDARTVVLVAEDASAYGAAAELISAGLSLRAVLDRRPGGPSGSGPELPAVEVVHGVTALRARGRDRVTEVVFESAGRRRRIRCDVVGMSGGWQAADELLYAATSDGQAVVEGRRAAEFRTSANGGRELPLLEGVGAVAGTMDAEAVLAEGRQAGAAAAEAVRG